MHGTSSIVSSFVRQTLRQPIRYMVMLGMLAGGSGLPICHADTFGSGENSFEIDFVTIGAPRNPSEGFPFFPSPSGSVDYVYRIGKYEISTDIIAKANVQWEVDGVLLGISYRSWDANFPAANITWYEAARFVNWMNASSGSSPAYKFDNSGEFQLWQPSDAGFNSSNPFRNTRARYFLPSADEWHKAAFYDPIAGVYHDYATGTDSQPDGIDFPGDPNFEAVYYDGGNNQLPNEVYNVGIPSPFGTFGQNGNVWEWEESSYDLTHDEAGEDRSYRGGAWYGLYNELLSTSRGTIGTFVDAQSLGFRVASVPEPSSAALCALLLFCISRRIRRAR